MNSGEQIDALFSDFSKAFDNVWKLDQFFLQGQFQSVVINGVNSKPSSVLSGVPQGMVLAPLYTVLLN